MNRMSMIRLIAWNAIFFSCGPPLSSQARYDNPFGVAQSVSRDEGSKNSLQRNVLLTHPRPQKGGFLLSPPQIVSVLAPDTLVRPQSGFYLFEVQATVFDPDSIEDVDSVWFYSRNSPNPNNRFFLRYHPSGGVWSDTFQINSQANLGTYPFVFYAKDHEGNLSDSLVHNVAVIAPTSVVTHKAISPEGFALFQNYPNPFNPATTISFGLPSKSFVSLRVFDALGREVSVLLSEALPAGLYSKQWNAEGLASGVYFYRIQAGNFVEMRKLLLLR